MRGLYSGFARRSGQNLQEPPGQFRVTVRLMPGVDDIADAVNDLPVPVKSQAGAVNLSPRQNRSVIIKPAGLWAAVVDRIRNPVNVLKFL
jgi:hypothetical protein